MSVYKDNKSPYWQIRFQINGIRVQESSRANSKREAEEYEDKLKRDLRRQLLLGEKPNRTWPEAEMRWLEEKKHKRSLERDIYVFQWLEPHLKHYALKDITKDVIEMLAKQKESETYSGKSKPITASTINKMLALIGGVLNRACKQWEWIEKVPAMIKRKESKNRIRWLTREEADRLLSDSGLPFHLWAMIKFSLATGLRESNVVNLPWADVDMERRHVIIHGDASKNEKPIPVPLNDDAMDVLYKCQGQHATRVFVYDGKPVASANTKAFNKALARAGITNFRWHDLRHTWASWHVQSGTSLQELQLLGGWKRFDMVLRYAHLNSTQLMTAANRINNKGQS